MSWAGETRPFRARSLRALQLSAPRLLLASFAGLIAFGTAGLMLLPGIYAREPLGFVDALFTITSAVCVTGLSVADVGTRLTPFGQAWLLLMIQAGGIGIMTFAALAAGALAGRSSLAVEEAAAGPAAVLPAGSPLALMRLVVISTLLVEAVGAAALFALWAPRFGAGEAAWPALFHAVSAFCNAGFSLFPDNLAGFREDPATLLLIGALLVAGGLGFVVVQDLRFRVAGRKRRLSTHSRLALLASGWLLAGATLLFLLFESAGTLAGLGFGDRVVNAAFMAATPRTAGFNAVDYDAISDPSLFLTFGLMWIGGSPGSTAGGVKTTTVALLALLLFARLRGDRAVSTGGRTVPADTLQRAAGLAVGSVMLLALFSFALLVTELPARAEGDRVQLVRLAFEAQSALGTVGLSMGATPQLTPTGRLLLVALMFLGRVGPLAVVGAMTARGQRRVAMRYAHEDVLVG